MSNLTRSGLSWSDATVTFSFPATKPSWAGAEGNGFSAFSAAQKDMGRFALGLWDDLANIDFVEVSSGGQINMSNTTKSIGYAHAYFPGSGGIAGSLWLNPTYNSSWGTNDLVTPKIGQWGGLTYIHELGHALGLDHPGNYNGGNPTYGSDAIYSQDTIQYTVMSYFDADNTGADWIASDGRSYYAQTPMLHDVLAIQALYGVEMSTRTGDTVYGFNSNTDRPQIFDFTVNKHPILTIWDAGGKDWLDLSGFSTNSRIDLNPGTYSDCDGMTKNIAIAYNCYIENAAGGSGNDTITGNDLDNILRGNAGDDILTGGGGADILIGGDGNDTFYADTLDILTSFSGGLGHDILYISGTLGYVFDYLAYGFEEMYEGGGGPPPPPPPPPTLLNGTAFADLLNGSAGDDTMNGFAGNDKLYGLDGDDLLNGGAGSDYINGGNGNDTVTYADASAGVTLSLASASGQVTGGSGSDTVINVENLIGSAFKDTLTGSAAANRLEGGDGNDTLNGGAGADTLVGGNDNDSLIGGTDADTMQGGNGNDIYYVDNVNDIVDETGTDGIDKVMSSISFSLADGTHVLGEVENLVLTGNAAINATGNSLDNVITGNAGSNILDGGDGTDTLSFDGMTRAVVVDLSVTTAQVTPYGTDTYLNFENLTGGSAADTLTGSAGDNVLSGGGNADKLFGGAGNDTLIGGIGADRLTGGADSDVFCFKAVSESTTRAADSILDFQDGIDKIDLSAIDAITGGSDDGFQFIGNAAFVPGAAGKLQVTTTATQTFVQGDVNGDGRADFKIILTGVHDLHASDFIL
ncbi:M10 family metallopeptidase C-terminal domain-containing protein [Aestuariivirga sp.]|uniref:M10 family metallopeptidase C-terminal domain-containing protein n=1 Tax=Aestuariivirga sp. TaxID=2650926 RepID=UPI0039E43659